MVDLPLEETVSEIPLSIGHRDWMEGSIAQGEVSDESMEGIQTLSWFPWKKVNQHLEHSSPYTIRKQSPQLWCMGQWIRIVAVIKKNNKVKFKNQAQTALALGTFMQDPLNSLLPTVHIQLLALRIDPAPPLKFTGQ